MSRAVQSESTLHVALGPPESGDEPPISLDLASVHRAAAGDPAAQQWLVGRVMATVRKIARALSTSAADADDAAQTALIEILRSAHSFRGRSSIEGWAGRIATRVCLRNSSRERRRALRLQLQAPEVAPPTPASPRAVVEALPRDLREYIDALPETQRSAIVLRHALGYTLEEIAELTAVSKNTVKGRLRLGTAALRKLVRRDLAIGKGSAT